MVNNDIRIIMRVDYTTMNNDTGVDNDRMKTSLE